MQQIRSFGVLQTAKVLGVLYLVGSAIVIIPVSLIRVIIGNGGIMLLIILPLILLYGVIGFVSTVVGCFLYNFIASKVGGIELELE